MSDEDNPIEIKQLERDPFELLKEAASRLRGARMFLANKRAEFEAANKRLAEVEIEFNAASEAAEAEIKKLAGESHT